jgi:AraC family transcriptional regulator
VTKTSNSLDAAKRVSVNIGSRSVPLFPGRPVIGSERSPWNGLVVERHHHNAVAIPKHEHATFCLHLQTTGPVSMDWQSSGKRGHLHTGAGNLILLTPGTQDSLVWHGPSSRVVLSIDPGLIHHAAEQMEIKGRYDFENCWSFEDEQLRHLVTEMDREMASGWAMGSLYGDLLGVSLSVVLLKKYAHTASTPLSLKGGLSHARLKQVLAYIEENFHRDIRLQELATLADLSLFHFARSFRESCGVTPYQHIVQRRIEYAQSLLRRPEWTIDQIASASGFGGRTQFARIFREHIGATPTDWRRSI